MPMHTAIVVVIVDMAVSGYIAVVNSGSDNTTLLVILIPLLTTLIGTIGAVIVAFINYRGNVRAKEKEAAEKHNHPPERVVIIAANPEDATKALHELQEGLPSPPQTESTESVRPKPKPRSPRKPKGPTSP